MKKILITVLIYIYAATNVQSFTNEDIEDFYLLFKSQITLINNDVNFLNALDIATSASQEMLKPSSIEDFYSIITSLLDNGSADTSNYYYDKKIYDDWSVEIVVTPEIVFPMATIVSISDLDLNDARYQSISGTLTTYIISFKNYRTISSLDVVGDGTIENIILEISDNTIKHLTVNGIDVDPASFE